MPPCFVPGGVLPGYSDHRAGNSAVGCGESQQDPCRTPSVIARMDRRLLSLSSPQSQGHRDDSVSPPHSPDYSPLHSPHLPGDGDSPGSVMVRDHHFAPKATSTSAAPPLPPNDCGKWQSPPLPPAVAHGASCSAQPERDASPPAWGASARLDGAVNGQLDGARETTRSTAVRASEDSDRSQPSPPALPTSARRARPLMLRRSRTARVNSSQPTGAAAEDANRPASVATCRPPRSNAETPDRVRKGASGGAYASAKASPSRPRDPSAQHSRHARVKGLPQRPQPVQPSPTQGGVEPTADNGRPPSPLQLGDDSWLYSA